jgi:hypothetical protein
LETSTGSFAENPGGHAAEVLDDGGFEGVDQDGVELVSEVEEHFFVDEEPVPAVGHLVEASVDAGEVHADAGAEADEEQAAGLEDAPEFGEHGAEVVFVAGEVEDGGAEDGVSEGIREGHALDGGDLEVFRWQAGVERGGEIADVVDGFGVEVGGVDVAAFAEEMDEVAAVAAAGVDDAHAGSEIAAEDLVEDVDVDGAELILKGWGQERPFLGGVSGASGRLRFEVSHPKRKNKDALRVDGIRKKASAKIE